MHIANENVDFRMLIYICMQKYGYIVYSHKRRIFVRSLLSAFASLYFRMLIAYLLN